MPLPFLHKKQVAGLIMAKRKPDGGSEEIDQESEENYTLKDCAEDLIRAINAKDAKGVSDALEEAFEKLKSGKGDAEPHSYEAQNEQANEGE